MHSSILDICIHVLRAADQRATDNYH
jgi:hypothetical protein